MKKYIAMQIALFLILTFIPAFASDNIEKKVPVDNLNKMIKITLKAEAQTKVGLEIIYPEGEMPTSYADSVTLMSNFAYVGQKTTDEDGEAVFTYLPKAKTGEYTVRTSPNVQEMSVTMEVPNPFFVLTWPYDTTFEQDNIYDSAIVWKNRLDTNGVSAEVTKTKNKLDALPEGKRSILVYQSSLTNAIFENADNYIWCEENAESVKTIIDSFFKEYYNAGGKLDYVQIDMELEEMSVYALGTDPSVYKQIAEDERYSLQIRPLLEERGYGFSDNAEYGELYTINESPNSYIWDTVMLNRSAEYLKNAVYLPIKQYFPEVKFSNYGYIDGEGWNKVPQNSGGRLYLGGSTLKVGTHSCVSMYGSLGWIAQAESTKPENYYERIYENTPFHSLMFDNNKLRKAFLGDEEGLLQAWVCPYNVNYGYANSGYGNTSYYAENIFHTGLLNPDPFLFQGLNDDSEDGVTPDDAEREKRIDTLSSLIDELNELAGFSDRRPLCDSLTSWNDHYLLSGMYANGKNIWRITPDLSVSGTTLEGFCINKETPTFYIGGKTITFPQGEIYEPLAENANTCGYWVITPADVEPTVSYDAKSGGAFDISMEIYDAESGTVTKTIPKEGGMAARVSYNNLSSENENVTVFMASYEGNKLQSAKILKKQMAFSGKDNIIVIDDILKPEDEVTRVAFYVFGDNLKPFVPLADLSRG